MIILDSDQSSSEGFESDSDSEDSSFIIQTEEDPYSSEAHF